MLLLEDAITPIPVMENPYTDITLSTCTLHQTAPPTTGNPLPSATRQLCRTAWTSATPAQLQWWSSTNGAQIYLF